MFQKTLFRNLQVSSSSYSQKDKMQSVLYLHEVTPADCHFPHNTSFPDRNYHLQIRYVLNDVHGLQWIRRLGCLVPRGMIWSAQQKRTRATALWTVSQSEIEGITARCQWDHIQLMLMLLPPVLDRLRRLLLQNMWKSCSFSKGCTSLTETFWKELINWQSSTLSLFSFPVWPS